MKIGDMFVKDIGRDIQGVIIAGQGDDSAVANELDEYVVFGIFEYFVRALKLVTVYQCSGIFRKPEVCGISFEKWF